MRSKLFISIKLFSPSIGKIPSKLKEGKDLIRYFCTPCKPTKTNGGRTRNLPEHAPDKWEKFKKYNKRDVEVELAIKQKLSKFPVPDRVWEEYILDQEINDRGILIDMPLVEKAIAFDKKSKAAITAAMKERTGLENPNSVLQMHDWLQSKGIESDSLDKKAIKELLLTVPEDVADFKTISSPSIALLINWLIAFVSVLNIVGP